MTDSGTKRLRYGWTGAFGVAVLLVVIAANTIVSLSATRELIKRNSAVERTRVVSDELGATSAALLNAETGERGYLYTGDPRYLEPYELAQSELDAHLKQLAGLTADNPTQQNNLRQLKPMVQELMAFFEQAIDLEKKGQHEAAKALVVTGIAKARMDGVRTVLSDMRAEELKLLAVRGQRSQQSARYLMLAIPISHGLTALLVLLAGLLVSQDLRKRAQTARSLRELATREHDARQQAEAAHQRTENVLSAISEMFILLDHGWKIAYVNQQVLTMTGKSREELIGKEYWSAFPGVLGTDMEAACRDSVISQNTTRLETFNEALSKWFDVHLYPFPEGLTVFAQDITGLKQARDALIRAEKLSAVGRMAATVAHEINNPLEAITNLIWIARRDPTISQDLRNTLQLADDELKRVAQITKQTLGFYRDASAPGPVRMRELMDSVLSLYASRLASKQASVHKEYEECELFGNAGELRQLFSNLCANAIEALQPGGMLAIKVSRSQEWTHSNGEGIRTTFVDNGCGIAPAHLDHLFEPFFTTKAATGTGLGLWVAKQIVEKHSGSVKVRSNASEKSHYTAISIFLPFHSQDQTKEIVTASQHTDKTNSERQLRARSA